MECAHKIDKVQGCHETKEYHSAQTEKWWIDVIIYDNISVCALNSKPISKTMHRLARPVEPSLEVTFNLIMENNHKGFTRIVIACQISFWFNNKIR